MRECSARIDGVIEGVLDRAVDDDWMRGAISYQLGWADRDFTAVSPGRRCVSGARLRPFLAILAHQSALAMTEPGLPVTEVAGRPVTEVAGRPVTEVAGLGDVVAFAAAVELVHNFSLIHDDIEGGRRVRRGRPALWTVLGASPAMEVGNCIHALAHVCLAGVSVRGPSPALLGDLIGTLAKSTVRLTVGQRRAISRGQAIDVDWGAYLLMIAGKSAALASCAAYGGALLALGDGSLLARRRTKCYAEFGRQLGLASRIRDDIRAIWGDGEAGGEHVPSDIRRRTESLPVVFALGEARGEAGARLRHLCSLSTELTGDQELEVRGILDACNAARFAQRQAELHGERALCELAGAVEGLETSPSISVLRELTNSLTAQTH